MARGSASGALCSGLAGTLGAAARRADCVLGWSVVVGVVGGGGAVVGVVVVVVAVVVVVVVVEVVGVGVGCYCLRLLLLVVAGWLLLLVGCCC